ncbi:magnesium transporter protection protein MgtU [Yokenella regensburgei]
MRKNNPDRLFLTVILFAVVIILLTIWIR